MGHPLARILAISALALAATTVQAQTHVNAPYGQSSAGQPARVIVIDSGTRHINVTRLETVGLQMGEKKIVWNFDTLGTRSFPLSKIVPGAESITVYVEESPLYRNGQ